MGMAIVKFRDQEAPVQYNGVDRVAPFGSQAVSIEDKAGMLIIPMARVTELILVLEDQEEPDGE